MWWHTRRSERVHLNRRGRQLSRLLAAEVRASTVVMLDTPCSEVVWRVLAAHSIRQFPLHFPSRASPCVITFQLESNNNACCSLYSISITGLNPIILFSFYHCFGNVIWYPIPVCARSQARSAAARAGAWMFFSCYARSPTKSDY